MNALSNLTQKELNSYGVKNEVMRYVGKGKRVVPAIIPFINNKQMDITSSLQAQGINPSDYTGNDQFDTPAGIVVKEGAIKKVPLITSRDSLFLMKYAKFWARENEKEQVWPENANNPIYAFNNKIYDKFTGVSWPLLRAAQGQIAGSVASPTNVVTAFSTFDTRVIFEGLMVIVPLWGDDANTTNTDPTPDNTTVEGKAYVQAKLTNVTTTQFELLQMDGTPLNVKFNQNVLPLFHPIGFGGDPQGGVTPLTNNLKVALYAKSPHASNIYGGLSNVPAIDDQKKSFPHTERVFASTLQGRNGGNAHVEREYLFPMDSTILFEFEAIFNGVYEINQPELLVNGFVFGYKIYDTAKGIK